MPTYTFSWSATEYARAVVAIGRHMRTPVAFTPERGVVGNQACAQSGTCCPEPGSTCVIGTFSKADAYFKESGSCKADAT